MIAGIVTGLCILVASITAAAMLIAKNNIGIEQSGTIAGISYAASVAAGCFLTARRAAQRKLIYGAVTALVLFTVILGLRFSLLNTKTAAIGRMLGITAAACLAGGYLGSRKKRTGYV